MASLFDKDPSSERPLTNREKIESEVAHLRKRSSVREGPGARARKSAPYFITLVVCGVLWLYLMDPVLYAYHKTEAIRTYLYLHNYGSQSKIDELLATHMFTAEEIVSLDHRTGSFQEYFPSPHDAEQKADAILNYIQSVRDLHAGKYDKLDTLGKIRFVLFIKFGIPVPTVWGPLNPVAK
ncbi:MAG: hypothetical protein LV479_10225 [Methylacidiphilales bacterium]|nr:hypothetical protein [Candidatus Methylacidiphilales bacterium]